MKVWQANSDFIIGELDGQMPVAKSKAWAKIHSGEQIMESEMFRTVWVKGHPFDMYGIGDSYKTKCTMTGTIPENNAVPGSGGGQALSLPVEYDNNPIYPTGDPLASAQRALLYFPNGFDIGGLGTFYKYVMVWANDNYNVIKVSGSNDFKDWTYIADCVGVHGGSHPAIVQTSATTFRIHYIDVAFTSTITDLRTATTTDFVNYTGETHLLNDPSAPFITGHDPDWNRNSYGMNQVFYNPTATNTGTDPRNYSYMAYFDGTNGSFESVGLCYGSDGITFRLYGTGPVLNHTNGTWGSSTPWDSSYVTDAQVFKVGSTYIMFYAGGTQNVLEGVGMAVSDDGLVWQRRTVTKPVIAPDGGAWRTTAASFPSFVSDFTNRFSGAGDIADIKMIVSGGDASTWTYSNGVFYINLVDVFSILYSL